MWCQMRRANSSRNIIQVENVNCGMQFRQHQFYSVSSQGYYVITGPQHVAKSSNKCSQQDYLISIILDCSCLICLCSSPRCHTFECTTWLSWRESSFRRLSWQQISAAPAPPRLILLIEERFQSARCLYHQVNWRRAAAARQSVFDSRQLAKTVVDQRCSLKAGAAGLISGSES